MYQIWSSVFTRSKNRCGVTKFNSGQAHVILWHISLCNKFVSTSFYLPKIYIGWQWHNFIIPIYASCSCRRDVGQLNVNILQHLQSDRWSSGSNNLFLNILLQFYLNNVTNHHYSWLRKVRHHAVRHGDCIVTIVYCGVTWTIYRWM